MREWSRNLMYILAGWMSIPTKRQLTDWVRLNSRDDGAAYLCG